MSAIQAHGISDIEDAGKKLAELAEF